MTVRRARGALPLVVVLAVLVSLLGVLPAQAVTSCSRGTVALTFDDGPHSSYTPRVLDILRKRGVKATFFQVGSRIATYPGVTRRVRAEGHRVANHTWNHESLPSLTDDGIRATLRRTNNVVTSLGLPRPTLVRPPYGATSSRVRSVIEDLGMHQVLWTIDPQDWRTGRSASTIANAVLGSLHNRGNILLHDGVGNSPATIAALPRIIDGARARGYCFGTLSASGAVTPPRPAARIGNTTVTETDPGRSVTAYLTVRLSEPTSRSVSFRYRTVDGTATAGADYVAASGTLTFPVGQTSRRIAVRVKGDSLDEIREAFTVRLSRASGASLVDRVGRVRIVDNDPAPVVRVSDASVGEPGPGATRTASVSVRLSAPSGRKVTVGYTTADGTATAGRDYDATSGTLTFAPGQTAKTVAVTVRGDALDEPDETFRVRLRDPSACTIGRGTATVTIRDGDPPPTVSIQDASVVEGAAGSSVTATLAVTLSARSAKTITVGYATADGTATAPADYAATSGTLTFAPGQTKASVAVTVRGDDDVEGDEAFSVTLSNPSNTTLARGSAVVTIFDDDTAPSEATTGPPE
jgi:peptidoglycan-N-acetylglucosamine deacetylase